MHPDKLATIIKASGETGCLPDGSRGCLLCKNQCPDGEPVLVEAWIAERELQRRLGCSEKRLANGGRRVMLYLLCQSCFDRPTRTEDVEAEILRRVTVQ